MIDDWQTDCLHWYGKVLTGTNAHWCFDWDGLPIDDTCVAEMARCSCEGGNQTPKTQEYLKAVSEFEAELEKLNAETYGDIL